MPCILSRGSGSCIFRSHKISRKILLLIFSGLLVFAAFAASTITIAKGRVRALEDIYNKERHPARVLNPFTQIIAVAFLLFAAVPSARGDDRLLFDRAEHQLGPLSEGRVHQFKIPLKNATGSPLHIISVEATCVYMEASIDRSDLEAEGTAVLDIRIDTAGNLGKLTKIVTILTNASSEPHILAIRGTIVHREYDHGRPRTMFTGACKKCHVGTHIEAKKERDLYDAVCYLCHKDALLNAAEDVDALRRIIAYGVPGTAMPGFGELSGGPLTMPQIDSLAGLFKSKPGPAGN